MISVCIPVFNSDVRELAGSLLNQAGSIPAEILIIDDGSGEEFRKINRTLGDRGIRYHELSENTGRSAVRNRFAGMAGYNHLLFLDCDSVILSGAFLSNYARALRDHPEDVICGGRVYDPHPPARKWRLHWKYGMKTESQPLELRVQHPDRSFMTNNFLIPAACLRETPFDERIKAYGHEDTLFGFSLSKKGRSIAHIDNPVMHGTLASNREFLGKTREAVRNLVWIAGMFEADEAFADSVKLLRTVRRLDRSPLSGILRAGSAAWIPLSAWLLRNGCTDLRMLDTYKLGLFLRLRERFRARGPEVAG